jgi:hypothetical protein
MSSLHFGLGVRVWGRHGACAGRGAGGLKNVDLPTTISASQSRKQSRSYTTNRSTFVCGTIRSSGLLRYTSPVSALQCRHNSSSSPNTAKPATPAILSVSESRQPANREIKGTRSAFAKFRASLSLADQGNVTSEESASSGVKKLLNLAKPEARQLGIAVGLVSFRNIAHSRRRKKGDGQVGSTSFRLAETKILEIWRDSPVTGSPVRGRADPSSSFPVPSRCSFL